MTRFPINRDIAPGGLTAHLSSSVGFHTQDPPRGDLHVGTLRQDDRRFPSELYIIPVVLSFSTYRTDREWMEEKEGEGGGLTSRVQGTKFLAHA